MLGKSMQTHHVRATATGNKAYFSQIYNAHDLDNDWTPDAPIARFHIFLYN